MQQFLIVNRDKAEYLDPHTFGDGRKLREFGGIGGITMAALAWLLTDHNEGDVPEHPLVGRWSGDRVVIAGQNAPGGVGLPEKWLSTWREKQQPGSEFGEKPNLYTYAQACATDISAAACHLLTQEPAIRAQSERLGRTLASFVSDTSLVPELRALVRGEEHTPSTTNPDDTSMFALPEE